MLQSSETDDFMENPEISFFEKALYLPYIFYLQLLSLCGMLAMQRTMYLR